MDICRAPAEIELILKALEYNESEQVISRRQHIAVAFLFALETAMRQGEIWKIQWQDVNLAKRYVTLPDTKNGTRRDVPLSKRAVELLQKLNFQNSGRAIPFNQDSCATIFRRAVEITGTRDLHFHDTRHTAITRLAKKLPVLDLAWMVGHKD